MRLTAHRSEVILRNHVSDFHSIVVSQSAHTGLLMGYEKVQLRVMFEKEQRIEGRGLAP